MFSPSIPTAWGKYCVQKVYRGQKLSVRFHNPDHVPSGVKKVTVNGKELAPREDGRFILDPAGLKSAAKSKSVCIDVLMG
jgi:cellobiose phosphorylase